MGERAVEFVERAPLPARRLRSTPAPGRDAAVHADDRGARDARHRRRRSTSRPRRRRSGTPSRRSARGGRSSRRTEPRRRAPRARGADRRARVYGAVAARLPGLSRDGPIVFAASSSCPRSPRRSGSRSRSRGRRLAAARRRGARRRSRRRFYLSPSARSSTSRSCSPSSLFGFWFLTLFEELWWLSSSRSSSRGSTSGRSARADEVRRRGAAGPLRADLGRVPAPGRDGTANIGPPDIVFFALFLAAAAALRAPGRPGPGSAMTGLLSLTLILVYFWDDVAGLPALPAVCFGFLLAERRPALARRARGLCGPRAGGQVAGCYGSALLEERDRLDVRRVREHVDRDAAASS